MTASITRPDASEFVSSYGAYVSRVPDGDVLEMLETQRREMRQLLAGMSEAVALRRYAAGKWSVKEVIGHLMDTERIFGYRALRFARGDETPLPGFDEQSYTPAGRFDERHLGDLADEWDAVRRATIALVRSFDAAALARRGTADGKAVSVRALIYIIAGHERHHLAILRERYLV
jgi:uncharacterized damage-inducible protein DinB